MKLGVIWYILGLHLKVKNKLIDGWSTEIFCNSKTNLKIGPKPKILTDNLIGCELLDEIGFKLWLIAFTYALEVINFKRYKSCWNVLWISRSK